MVQEERSKIEDKRAETVQAQEKAVKDLETEARAKQASATQSINQRVAQDQAKIDTEFSKAKSKSDAEVRKGEQKAAAEKKKAEEGEQEELVAESLRFCGRRARLDCQRHRQHLRRGPLGG